LIPGRRWLGGFRLRLFRPMGIPLAIAYSPIDSRPLYLP